MGRGVSVDSSDSASAVASAGPIQMGSLRPPSDSVQHHDVVPLLVVGLMQPDLGDLDVAHGLLRWRWVMAFLSVRSATSESFGASATRGPDAAGP